MPIDMGKHINHPPVPRYEPSSSTTPPTITKRWWGATIIFGALSLAFLWGRAWIVAHNPSLAWTAEPSKLTGAVTTFLTIMCALRALLGPVNPTDDDADLM